MKSLIRSAGREKLKHLEKWRQKLLTLSQCSAGSALPLSSLSLSPFTLTLTLTPAPSHWWLMFSSAGSDTCHCVPSSSSAVSFVDCGGGKVCFTVGDSSEFTVTKDGVVYAQRCLNLEGRADALLLVVYAQDVQTKQMWKTRVHFRQRPQGSSATPEQVTQQNVW